MSNTVGVLSELYPSEAPGFTSGLWWVHVVQLVWFSVLCFVCLRPVCCMLGVAIVFRLSILDCLFGFL